MYRKPMVVRVLVGAVLLGVLGVLSRTSDAIIYTHGCRVTVTQIRAGKEGRDGKEFTDPELSRPDVRALKRKYKKGYKSYEMLSRGTQQMGFGDPVTHTLANGKTLTLTIESHRQALINMRLEMAGEVQKIRVSSGRRGLIAIRYEEEGEDALVIMVRPRLLQSTRK